MSGEDGAEGDPSSRIASENRNAVALFRSRGLNIPRNSGRAGRPMPMWSNSPKLSFPHQRQHVPHPGLRWRWRGRRRNGCPRPHPPNGGDRPRSITVWRVCTYVPTNEHLELPYDTGEGASGSARTAASCGREAARKPRLRRGRSAWRSRELVVAALSHAGASHRDAAARRALSRRAVRLPALAVTRRRFSATPSLRDAVSPRRRFSATPFLRDAISPRRRRFSASLGLEGCGRRVGSERRRPSGRMWCREEGRGIMRWGAGL